MNKSKESRPRVFPAHIQVSNRPQSPVRQGSVARGGDRQTLPAVTARPVQRQSSRMHHWQTKFYDTAILPIQFFNEPGRASSPVSGAQRLMLAVLQDAVACWFRWRNGGTARRRRLFEETYSWFWSPNSSGLYAFEHICEVFKLDPGYIRRGLMRWHPDAQTPEKLSGLHQLTMPTRRAAIVRTPVLHIPPRVSGKSTKR